MAARGRRHTSDTRATNTSDDDLQRLLDTLVALLVRQVTDRYVEEYGSEPSTAELELLRRYLHMRLAGRWAA